MADTCPIGYRPCTENHEMKSIRVYCPCRLLQLSCLCLMWLATGRGALADDWPQLFGPSRNGVSPETGLLEGWPKEGPPLLWQRALGAGYSGPVVASDRLIAFDRLGDQEVVECLDGATGEPR